MIEDADEQVAPDDARAETAIAPEFEYPIAEPEADNEQHVRQENDSAALSTSRTSELDEQDRLEQEKEASLLATWQQTDADESGTASESEPTVQVPHGDEVAVEKEGEEDIDTGPPVELVDAKMAVSDMWDDLTEEPLPSEDDLESMFEEIRQLDQQEPETPQIDEEVAGPEEGDELKSILSSIPSFSQMNKKNDP